MANASGDGFFSRKKKKEGKKKERKKKGSQYPYIQSRESHCWLLSCQELAFHGPVHATADGKEKREGEKGGKEKEKEISTFPALLAACESPSPTLSSASTLSGRKTPAFAREEEKRRGKEEKERKKKRPPITRHSVVPFPDFVVWS